MIPAALIPHILCCHRYQYCGDRFNLFYVTEITLLSVPWAASFLYILRALVGAWAIRHASHCTVIWQPIDNILLNLGQCGFGTISISSQDKTRDRGGCSVITCDIYIIYNYSVNCIQSNTRVFPILLKTITYNQIYNKYVIYMNINIYIFV